MCPLLDPLGRWDFQAESKQFTFQRQSADCWLFQYWFPLPQITHTVDVHKTFLSFEMRSSFNYCVCQSCLINIHMTTSSNMFWRWWVFIQEPVLTESQSLKLKSNPWWICVLLLSTKFKQNSQLKLCRFFLYVHPKQNKCFSTHLQTSVYEHLQILGYTCANLSESYVLIYFLFILWLVPMSIPIRRF